MERIEKKEYFDKIEKELVTLYGEKKVSESITIIMTKIKTAYAMGAYQANKENLEDYKKEGKEK